MTQLLKSAIKRSNLMQLLTNPRGITKGDREEQDPKGQSQDQNVNGALHIDPCNTTD